MKPTEKVRLAQWVSLLFPVHFAAAAFVNKTVLVFFSFWLLIIQRFVRIIFHPKLFWQRQQLKDALKQRDISEVQKSISKQ